MNRGDTNQARQGTTATMKGRETARRAAGKKNNRLAAISAQTRVRHSTSRATSTLRYIIRAFA
jgi:hypothetical protein